MTAKTVDEINALFEAAEEEGFEPTPEQRAEVRELFPDEDWQCTEN